MSDLSIAITVLILTTFIGLLAFAGKLVLDLPDARIVKRITWRGYCTLVLTVAVLGLNIWKEIQREVSLSGRLPERFYELTEGVTGYGKEDWNRYIAIRLSVRFLLGKIYKNSFNTKQPPESIAVMLSKLTRTGTIPEDLCVRLNKIRKATYTIEWARGDEAGGTNMAEVRRTAPEAIKQLWGISDSRPSRVNSTNSACAAEIEHELSPK